MLVMKYDDIISINAAQGGKVAIVMRKYPKSTTIVECCNVKFGKDMLTRICNYRNMLYQSALNSTLKHYSDEEVAEVSSKLQGVLYAYRIEDVPLLAEN